MWIELEISVACEQALDGMGGPVRTPPILLFLPFFDISIIYANYLAHNLGSATEMIINITLVDDFMTFNISNYKNYLHLSIKLQLTIEKRCTKIRYIGKTFYKACLQALVSVIMNIGEIKNK